jgi:hypothetical protein
MCGEPSVPGPDDQPADPPAEPPAEPRGDRVPGADARRPGDEAIVVETYVSEASGRWMVEIVVIFPDEAVRRTVNHYRTKRQADIAASWIKRAAQRDIEGPAHG